MIENFKVGGLKQYGLDYDSLKQINPGLIYCPIAGFGQNGSYSSRAGYDFLIQGMGDRVLSDSGINKVQDLKGKILAVTAKGTGFHYAQLREAGLGPNAYTIVEVGRGAMDAALRERRVDLVYDSAPFLFETERKGGVKRWPSPTHLIA